MIIRYGILAVAVLLLSTTAAAADGPPTWTGLHVGLNAGYGWADVNGDPIKPTPEFPNGVDPDTEPNGWFGGGQIGYNFQSGSIVFGVEADYQAASMDDRLGFEVGLYDGVGKIETEITSFGSVRGRLGVAMGSVFPYVTGGFAWADVEANNTVIYGPEPGDIWRASDSAVHTGWVVGGGVEIALDQTWSIKGEYLYFDLGEESYTTTYRSGTGELGDTYKSHADVTMQTFRLGVNYRFGG